MVTKSGTQDHSNLTAEIVLCSVEVWISFAICPLSSISFYFYPIIVIALETRIIYNAERMKLKKQKNRKQLAIVLGVVLLALVGGSIGWKVREKTMVARENTARTQITSTPQIPSITISPVPGWKTFENDKVKMQYPADWTVDTNSHGDPRIQVSFKSGDYKDDGILPVIMNGYAVSLSVFPSSKTPLTPKDQVGIVWKKTITLLGNDAIFEKSVFDQNALVLITQYQNKRIFLTLSARDLDNKVPAENYSDLFLRVANTISIK